MYTFLSIYTLREKSAKKFLRKLYSRFSAKKKKKRKKRKEDRLSQNKSKGLSILITGMFSF